MNAVPSFSTGRHYAFIKSVKLLYAVDVFVNLHRLHRSKVFLFNLCVHFESLGLVTLFLVDETSLQQAVGAYGVVVGSLCSLDELACSSRKIAFVCVAVCESAENAGSNHLVVTVESLEVGNSLFVTASLCKSKTCVCVCYILCGSTAKLVDNLEEAHVTLLVTVESLLEILSGEVGLSLEDSL